MARNWEPPDDDEDGGPSLPVQDSARAAALQPLFLPANSTLSRQIDVHSGAISQSYVPEPVGGNLPRFHVPDFIIAPADSPKSRRPRQTVQPTALALGKPFDYTSYENKADDIVRLSTDLASNAKYAEK
jgi:hypothetical protein